MADFSKPALTTNDTRGPTQEDIQPDRREFRNFVKEPQPGLPIPESTGLHWKYNTDSDATLSAVEIRRAAADGVAAQIVTASLKPLTFAGFTREQIAERIKSVVEESGLGAIRQLKAASVTGLSPQEADVLSYVQEKLDTQPTLSDPMLPTLPHPLGFHFRRDSSAARHDSNGDGLLTTREIKEAVAKGQGSELMQTSANQLYAMGYGEPDIVNQLGTMIVSAGPDAMKQALAIDPSGKSQTVQALAKALHSKEFAELIKTRQKDAADELLRVAKQPQQILAMTKPQFEILVDTVEPALSLPVEDRVTLFAQQRQDDKASERLQNAAMLAIHARTAGQHLGTALWQIDFKETEGIAPGNASVQALANAGVTLMNLLKLSALLVDKPELALVEKSFERGHRDSRYPSDMALNPEQLALVNRVITAEWSIVRDVAHGELK